MATRSPFAFLDDLADSIGRQFAPPHWAVHEAQHRLVLLLNHILMQEPQAMDRLRRQAGRVVQAYWRVFSIRLVATPAGLLDLAGEDATPDLTLAVAEESPLALAQSVLRGEKPPVRIAGDVQFAAEVNWLVDHVRWDLEEDLARAFGDAPAHAMARTARIMAGALRRFVPRPDATAPGVAPAATPAGGPGAAATPGRASPTAGRPPPSTGPGPA